MATMTKREWKLWCHDCGEKRPVWCWDYELPASCTECGHTLVWDNSNIESYPAPAIAGDELNHYAANHGVCHPDGSPRKFNSKTELKRALNEAGLCISGDTPKPYHVQWSGKVPTNAKDPT